MSEADELRTAIKKAERDANLIPFVVIAVCVGLRWWWTGTLQPEKDGNFAMQLCILGLLVALFVQTTTNRVLLLKAELREVFRDGEI